MNKRHFFQLLALKVRLSLRSEASRNQLNYAWWILEPALFVAVFYVVFGIFMQRGGAEFAAFLVCGKVPFLWYSRSVSNASQSILAGRGLISQVAIPKVFFPLCVLLQDAVKQSFVWLLVLVFLLFSGYEANWNWLYLPLVVACQFTLVAASALLAATVVPIVPDFRFVISTGLMLLMFGSGIFYDYREFIDPVHQRIFLLNPLAALIDDYRLILLHNLPPALDRLTVIALLSLAASAAVAGLLARHDRLYSRLVMR